MENILPEKYYKIFLISFFAILALPIISFPPWFHPSAWGKAMVFRIIISILLYILIRLIFLNKNRDNIFPTYVKKMLLDRKNRSFWPICLLIVFWALTFLATIFSQDPFYSFWESPFRAGGFLNFSFYVVFFLLTFLIIKTDDWHKIWNFCLLIGVLASIIAVSQYFQILSKYLIPYEGRPPSTFGNSIFLAIYLLFLIFIDFYFILSEKKITKKLLYFSALLLFIFAVLITKNRAAYLGLFFGSFYFFFLYPALKQKKIFILKIIFAFLFLISIFGVYFINTGGKLPQFVEDNKTLKAVAPRLLISPLLQESRFPAWQIAIEGIKERPVLGYGPENFSIAFDKHYDPRVPELNRTWWDRTHNFMLEIAVTTGIPALIVYLSFLGVLFWQLQKAKKRNPEIALACHAIQAAFIGYLVTNFFSFDSFSTYIILFLLTAYSLYLINLPQKTEVSEQSKKIINSFPLWKSGANFVLFCILITFIWLAALKPLSVNKDINWANYYLENGQCDKSVEKMDSILLSHSIADSYARLQYIDILSVCLKQDPQKKRDLAQKAVSALREEKEIRPTYTRIWITLGAYLNILVENKDNFKIENAEELKEEAYSYFNKAYELGSRRQEMLVGWMENLFLSEKYGEAKEMADKCIALNEADPHCWWKKALANIYLQELEEADKNITMAGEKGQDLRSIESLSQLHRAYITVLGSTKDNKKLQKECYERLVNIYKEMASADPKNFQYRASAAHIYQVLGRYWEAREQALFMLSASKDVKDNVRAFLDLILSLDHDQFEHHFALAYFYNKLGEPEKSLEEARIARQFGKREEIFILGYNLESFIKVFPSF